MIHRVQEPDSEVNRLDRGDLSASECSPDMRHVIDECARLWQVTGGYFDAYATGRLTGPAVTAQRWRQLVPDLSYRRLCP